MTGKIESYGPQAAATPPRVGAAVPSAQAGKQGTIGAVTPADSVRLTDTARMLAELREHIAAAPTIDGKRVAETRLALAEGRYSVDPQRIADKLLRFEWALQRS
ncbi:flagellar biosynthesis anti-sigma factor FlgM [Sinimarinibacterium thermocellulolyticum]|uniref:Negative regulator of flagellin synthesis n=1 Tax=Sinimarinibacterium thermocellulolyticum TaxID=3170016 RepID=A0ABV2AA30_9GAMM